MNISYRLLLAVAVSAAIALAQDTPAPDQESNPTFKVNVKLVSVYATVTDKSGAPVTDLKRGDFSILEDQTPERIANFEQESERPISIVMAIDASGSVRKDLKLELESARKFVADILRPVDALSLYQFSEVVAEKVPFTSNLGQITRGIRSVQIGAGTALYDAMYLASVNLSKRQGRKVMVIISDGEDTLSATNYQDAVRAAQQSDALVYSIIMVPVVASAGRATGGENALIQVSRDTGGKYYYADSIASLDAAFQQISKELRTQYLIGYYPSRTAASSDFRRIDIQVRRPDLVAHHRAGYYTSKIE
jgi:Ca-activated chloride channel family protein